MPENSVPADESGEPVKALRAGWLNRGLTIRVFIYLAGSHLFAAFLFLLFLVGARHSH
jgi:hypothetical protein